MMFAVRSMDQRLNKLSALYIFQNAGLGESIPFRVTNSCLGWRGNCPAEFAHDNNSSGGNETIRDAICFMSSIKALNCGQFMSEIYELVRGTFYTISASRNRSTSACRASVDFNEINKSQRNFKIWVPMKS